MRAARFIILWRKNNSKKQLYGTMICDILLTSIKDKVQTTKLINKSIVHDEFTLRIKWQVLKYIND